MRESRRGAGWGVVDRIGVDRGLEALCEVVVLACILKVMVPDREGAPMSSNLGPGVIRDGGGKGRRTGCWAVRR